MREGSEPTVTVRVNGTRRATRSQSIASLLLELGYETTGGGLAVALNGEVLPRGRWDGTNVRDRDVLDVVGAVQGG